MKTGTIIAVGLGAAALYYYQQLNTAAQTVQFVFSGVQVNSPLSYNLQILIQNISNLQCTVNSLSGTVYINQNSVGNISDFTPVTIAGNSQQIVNVNLAVSVLGLPIALQSLLNTGATNLDFTVSGNANVNGLILPFNLEKILNAA